MDSHTSHKSPYQSQHIFQPPTPTPAYVGCLPESVAILSSRASIAFSIISLQRSIVPSPLLLCPCANSRLEEGLFASK